MYVLFISRLSTYNIYSIKLLKDTFPTKVGLRKILNKIYKATHPGYKMAKKSPATLKYIWHDQNQTFAPNGTKHCQKK